ncbi:tRNA(Met) cytidine acetyltransferase [Halogeometricum borinquense]|uniref:tRNA(Met) cytidine acetyltransferase TmcA n=1 Tax=Halogeometricum borinquense TaxID=60847 RepID=A0A6C0UI47_9EURY|nr:tRNA(Met) cytidine acetyltransferase TmcA [Halogeometricum borinquense]QIB74890.1 tRNA(Met) cytidine acetyltransferase [Halogeometricum borinquense]QIQ76111.1 tRNA(Met) cytidine acetyltransferase [Halogeometricum borinquense]
MNLAALAADLRTAARDTNQRRLLVLAGDRDAGIDAAFDVLDGADVPDDEVAFVTAREGFRFERVRPKHARTLLGTTRTVVVCDAHEEFSPNVLGRLAGVVDGGGLFVLLAPPLDEWPETDGSFEESLAVPPVSVSDVGGRFRTRLVETLRTHPGIAIVNLGTDTVERNGSVDAPPGRDDHTPSPPHGHAYPRAAYDACLTADQSRTLAALERLRNTGEAVVVEADRGRGKSSAAGLAAGSLAADGRDVLVTAPAYGNAREVFARAIELLRETGTFDSHDEEAHVVSANGGGRIRFTDPPTAATRPEDPDVLLVDEAAAVPVRLLAAFADAPSAGFFTTVHGYEGAGRGFSVRFRDRLAESDLSVTDVQMDEPIRYARGDPVETWAFRTLLLDARPAVDPLVADATPESTEYRALSADELASDEHLLREVFGLLVLAHYRTEPNDLARLLDAPNLECRALMHDGHVVSVALLAREGGLDAETRRSMYEGERVRGNMLPDVFTSQLRDEDAAAPIGYRVMRIATHHAVRSSGLGSRLLSEIRAEKEAKGDGNADVDYLGVGYGATPELLSFWDDNGYSTVHFSTTRNETSGEYSALMLNPLTEAGQRLHDRHAGWFLDRMPGVLSDPLSDADPDVVRAAIRACDASPPVELTDREWRVVVGASFGPGMYTTAPDAFRTLAHRALNDNDSPCSPEAERLLVRKVLQGTPWATVADELDYHSTRNAMKALGDASVSLVERYGSDVAAVETERKRFEQA